MNADWLAWLAQQPTPPTYPTQTDAPRLYALSDFAVLDFHGEDTQAFLQGQLSSDVREVNPQHAQYSSYSTAKGRMLASFLVWQTQDHFRLMVRTDLAEAMKKRLGMFILRAKVKVALDGDSVLLGLSGAQAGELARQVFGQVPSAPGEVTQGEYGSLLALAGDRLLLDLNASAAPSLWQALCAGGAQAVSQTDWHAQDIAHGLPWISAATQELFVAQMANMELIGAVSFKKGCYPGQEIVARTQYLGKTKRRMFRVHLDANDVSAGQALFSPATAEQTIGHIVNAVPAPTGGSEALAVFQLPALESGVHLGTLDGPALQVLPLPYAVPQE